MTNRTYIGVDQDITMRDGKYVQMPVWFSGEPNGLWSKLAFPNPHARSSVGDVLQDYPVGTRFVDGDRTFHYGAINQVVTGNKANIGVFNINELDIVTWGATAGIAGDTVVGVLASTMDVDTTPARDFFAGGYFMPRTNPYSSYRVLASTTETGGRTSGEVDLTIDYGLVEAVAASVASCHLNRNEYTKLSQQWAGGINYATCPGVTLIDPIAGTHQWVQTYGPCFVVPYNEEIGATLGDHDCFFHIDGTIKVQTRASGALNQRAGYMINSSGTGTQATWFIKLQITP